MDDELKRLERAFKMAPDDEGAARAYHAALLRVGKRERVREAYGFKFQCPLRWSDLAATQAPGTKHCKECDRGVHLVDSPEKLREHVAAGRCVAVVETNRVRFVDALVDEPGVHGAEDPGAPCIVVVEPAKPEEPRRRMVMGIPADPEEPRERPDRLRRS